ncbi:EamA domain - like 6 [Theobroma cacao]|nr:EamA domain - like 6 [Theobroma cacao]
MAWAFKVPLARYKPHLSMVLAQIGYTILYFFVEASFNQGLNPHVYVTYRYILAGLLMSPFAYFLERKSRPKMTVAMFLELFLLSLIGLNFLKWKNRVGFTMNMYYASLRYTSPTFVASVFNTVSILTFVVAVILRMEVVNVRSPRGIAKILGTLTSLAGVTIITLYKGPAVHSLSTAPIHMERLPSVHENLVKGSILIIASCTSWALWFIMQAVTLKKYPAQLSLTAWMNCIGGGQSAVFAVFLQHKPNAWSINMFSIRFWTITYSDEIECQGIVCSGIFIFIQFWCMKEKGPVFVSMFSPLATVMVAISAYFVLGEKLYVGRILGGVLVIIGLYLLLWGKDRDQAYINTQEQPSSHCHGLEGTDKEDLTSGEKEVP